MVDEIAEVAIDVLSGIGSLGEPRKRRPSGCWWLAVSLGLAAFVVFIVIAINR